MTDSEDVGPKKTDLSDEDLAIDQEPQSDSESASPEETSVNSSTDSAVEELEKIKIELDKQKDLALRAEAELQNVLKRTAREVENAHKYGLERFIENLLPVVDSLEKAAELSIPEQSASSNNAIEGINLCCKLLLDVLEKEGIKAINPLGEPFDPSEHQAMSMVENPDMEPNSIAAVVQKGWKLNERLVRAAMVMVVKESESTSPE
ncbi:MAG: nucleotide exchange factor GrpE [Pseudomonadota bacterium]|nr:nucleotide exchange factor GrpE [Pseudomonadota bacterium]